MEPIPPIYPRDQKSWEKQLIRHARAAGFACDDPSGLVRTLLALYASMLADVCVRLNRAPENHLRYLLNQTQIKRLPGRAAQTIVSFAVADDQTDPVQVARGTLLSAHGEEDTVIFRVRETFDAHPVSLVCAGWADAFADAGALCVKDGEGMPFTVFRGACKPWHRLDIWFENAFSGSACRRAVRLRVRARLDGKPISLADADLFDWALCTEADADFITVTPEVSKAPDGMLLTFEDFPCTQPACLTLTAREAGLCGLTLKIEGARADAHPIQPLQVIRDGEQLPPEDFYPFGSPPQPYSECFVYGADVCGLAGSQITVSYAVELETAVETLPEVPEQVDFRWVMRKPAPKPEVPPAEVYVRGAQWSYWNGSAWCQLPIEQPCRFDAKQEQVEFSFACPEDLAQGGPDGGAGLLLRLSWAWDAALFTLPRRVFTPRLSNLTLSRRMSAVQPPIRAVCENYGVRTEADWARVIRPFTPPPCTGRAVFLGFDRPAKTKLQLLVALDGYGGEQGRTLSAFMECGEAEKPCGLYDETGGLTRTGLLSLRMPAHPAKTVLFGESCYWVRLEVSGSGAVPRIMGVYPNACKAEHRIRHTLDMEAAQIPPDGRVLLEENIVQAWVFSSARADASSTVTQELWHEYDPMEGAFACPAYKLDAGRGILTLAPFAQTPHGDAQALYRIVYDTVEGESANLPAGAVDRLYEESPLIAEVCSPLPATGGRAAETDDALYDRITCHLHAGGRAISCVDYARIAQTGCPLVQKARCTCKNGGLHLEILTREGEFAQAHDELAELFRTLGGHTLGGIALDIYPMAGELAETPPDSDSGYEAADVEGTMRLENLDNVTFEQLLTSAVARIPSLTAQWTDFSPADTGILLLETLSGLTEQLGYMLNLTDDVLLAEMLRLVYGANVEARSAADYAQRFARDYAQPARAATPAELKRMALESPFDLDRVYAHSTAQGVKLLVYRAGSPLTAQEEKELTEYLRFRCLMGVRLLVERAPCVALSVTVQARMDHRQFRAQQVRDSLKRLITRFLDENLLEIPLDLDDLREQICAHPGITGVDALEVHAEQDEGASADAADKLWRETVLRTGTIEILLS